MAQATFYVDNCTVGDPIPPVAVIDDLTLACPCVESDGGAQPALVDYERYTVCDVVQAQISGDVIYNVAGTAVNVSQTLVPVNDTVLTYIVDFGNGYTDVGNTPTFDFINEIPGHYELKFYVKLASGNLLLVSALEIDWDGVAISNLPNTQTTIRTYDVKAGSALANWVDGAFVSVTDLVGGAYTLQGTPSIDCPAIANDFLPLDEKTLTAIKSMNLYSGSLSIASGTYATLLGPDGTLWNNPGNLKSVTIYARKSNSSDAVVGSGANQVLVITTDNKYILLEGESATYSVEDGNIQDFVSVECLKNSACLIVYNRG
jgi:hypothetical protein